MKLERASVERVSYERRDRPQHTVPNSVFVLSGTESGYTVQREGEFESGPHLCNQ